MPGKTPSTFRTLDLIFDHKKFKIAGMAHPLGYFGTSGDSQAHLEYLATEGFRKIISLEVDRTAQLNALSKKYSINQFSVEVEDFYAPKVSDIFTIKSIIVSGTPSHTAIHCRGGNGRTGTILAALSLLSDIENTVAYSNEHELKAYDLRQTSSAHCFTGPVACSVLVKKHIDLIRALPNGRHSIETKVQIEFLNRFELNLINQLRVKQHLSPLPESTTSSGSATGAGVSAAGSRSRGDVPAAGGFALHLPVREELLAHRRSSHVLQPAAPPVAPSASPLLIGWHGDQPPAAPTDVPLSRGPSNATTAAATSSTPATAAARLLTGYLTPPPSSTPSSAPSSAVATTGSSSAAVDSPLDSGIRRPVLMAAPTAAIAAAAVATGVRDGNEADDASKKKKGFCRILKAAFCCFS